MGDWLSIQQYARSFLLHWKFSPGSGVVWTATQKTSFKNLYAFKRSGSLFTHDGDGWEAVKRAVCFVFVDVWHFFNKFDRLFDWERNNLDVVIATLISK